MNSPRSMRYQLEEVLAGMLATLSNDEFTDDTVALGNSFKRLAADYPLFAPYAALSEGGDYSVVLQNALATLVSQKSLTHGGGKYTITKEGREGYISTKRTLFNRADVVQLEEAARIFVESHA